MRLEGLCSAVLVRCRGLCGRNTVACAADHSNEGAPTPFCCRPGDRTDREHDAVPAANRTLQQLAQETHSLSVILLLLDESGRQVLWSNRDLDFQMLSCPTSESGSTIESPMHFLRELLGGEYTVETVLQSVQACGTWSNSVRSIMADALVDLQCNPYATPGDFVNPISDVRHSAAADSKKQDVAAVISLPDAARQYAAEPTPRQGYGVDLPQGFDEFSPAVQLPSPGDDSNFQEPTLSLLQLPSRPDASRQPAQTQLDNADDEEEDTHSPPRRQASSKVTFAVPDQGPLNTAFTVQPDPATLKTAAPNPTRSSLKAAAGTTACGRGGITFAGLLADVDDSGPDNEPDTRQASFQLPGEIPSSSCNAACSADDAGERPGSQGQQQSLALPTLALPSLGERRMSMDQVVTFQCLSEGGSMHGSSLSRQQKSVSYPAAGPSQWSSSHQLSQTKMRTMSLSEEHQPRGRSVYRSISSRAVSASRKRSLERSMSSFRTQQNALRGESAPGAVDDLQAAASRYQLGPKTAVLLQSLNRRRLSVGSEDKPHSSSASSRRGSLTVATSSNSTQDYKAVARHSSVDGELPTARQLSSSLNAELSTSSRAMPSQSAPLPNQPSAGKVGADMLEPQGPPSCKSIDFIMESVPPLQADEDSKPEVAVQPEAEQALQSTTERIPGDTTGQGEGDVPLHVAEVTIRMVSSNNGTRSMLLVSCHDISARAALEAMLSQLMESQMAMAGSMFPYHVIEQLCKPPEQEQTAMAQLRHDMLSNTTSSVDRLAKRHVDVTVLFMDIVGFTSMSKEVEPHQVMAFLNTLFSYFDELASIHRVHKVDTAGDCYIASAGLLEEAADGFLHVLESHNPADSAARMMAFAKDMLKFAQSVRMPHNQKPANIRIGMHTGNCMSGLLGSKVPKFSVYGDSVNTASRMESTSIPGRIQVSQATHALLPHEQWAATGGVEVKGKGTMLTYLWVPPSTTQAQTLQLKMKGRNSSVSFFSMLGGLQPQVAQQSSSGVPPSSWDHEAMGSPGCRPAGAQPRLLKQMTPPHELSRPGPSKSRRWSVDMSASNFMSMRANSFNAEKASLGVQTGINAQPALSRTATGPWQLLKPNGTAARLSARFPNGSAPRLSLGPLATGMLPSPAGAVPGFLAAMQSPAAAAYNSKAADDPPVAGTTGSTQQAWAQGPLTKPKQTLPPSLIPDIAEA